MRSTSSIARHTEWQKSHRQCPRDCEWCPAPAASAGAKKYLTRLVAVAFEIVQQGPVLDMEKFRKTWMLITGWNMCHQQIYISSEFPWVVPLRSPSVITAGPIADPCMMLVVVSSIETTIGDHGKQCSENECWRSLSASWSYDQGDQVEKISEASLNAVLYVFEQSSEITMTYGSVDKKLITAIKCYNLWLTDCSPLLAYTFHGCPTQRVACYKTIQCSTRWSHLKNRSRQLSFEEISKWRKEMRWTM